MAARGARALFALSLIAGGIGHCEFDPQCGHTQELGTCPGYRECLLRLMQYSEQGFSSDRVDELTGPLATPTRPRCTRTTCLDLRRCTLPFRVYYYNATELRARGLDPDVLECLGKDEAWEPQSSALLTNDPSQACVLWVNVRAACGKLRTIKRLPHWSDGLNHIIFETTDVGITTTLRNKHLGRAAVAQGYSSVERFAHGVDVAVPLRTSRMAVELEETLGNVLPWRRKWLITFKGTSSHNVRSRLAGYHDEPSRVVISVYPNPHHCTSRGYARTSDARRMTPLPDAPLINAACCARMHALYESYGYADLMNSTFGLVPPGRSPASYRLPEVMAAGCIPVFVGLEYAVLPFSELIQWSEFSLFAPANVDWPGALLPMLRELEADRARLSSMQQAVRKAYARYFRPTKPIVSQYAHIRRNVLDVFRQRFEYKLNSRR